MTAERPGSFLQRGGPGRSLLVVAAALALLAGCREKAPAGQASPTASSPVAEDPGVDLSEPLRDWRRRSITAARGPDCSLELAGEEQPLCEKAQRGYAELVTALDENAAPAVLAERAAALADAAARVTRAMRFRYMRSAGEGVDAPADGTAALRRQVEQLRGGPAGSAHHDHDDHGPPGGAVPSGSAAPVNKVVNPWAPLINGYAGATVASLRLLALLARYGGPRARGDVLGRVEAFYAEHPDASRTPFEEAALRETDPALQARLRAVLRPPAAPSAVMPAPAPATPSAAPAVPLPGPAVPSPAPASAAPRPR